ncbi:uncharacterized protein TNCV_8571 [Trichonephila clavipes]|nr:uncharacterized protein TNCV_8571 [Trichonephila clavipes]
MDSSAQRRSCIGKTYIYVRAINDLGPLTGYLGNKFGLRSITVFGCIASAFGIGLCFFAEDILAVTIFWGCLYGLGFGFGTSLLPAIVSLYFKENLTKASGLAYVGSSFGAALIPPFVEIVLKTYGLSGTFLILGALTLNGAAVAVLLKIPDPEITKRVVEATKTDKLESYKSSMLSEDDRDVFRWIKHVKKKSSKFQVSSIKTHGFVNNGFDAEERVSSIFRNGIDHRISVFKHNVNSDILPGTPILLDVHALDVNSSIPIDSKKILKIDEKSNISPVIPTVVDKKEHKSCLGSFHIFYDLTFICIMLIQSIFTLKMTIIWTVIIDYVRDKGIARSKEIYFMVCLPLSDMIGRLGLGFVVDSRFITLPNYCAVCFFLMGLASCFMIWSQSLALLMMSVFMLSLLTGGIMITFPGMIIDFMKSDDVTIAMASRMILFPPFSLTISPLIVAKSEISRQIWKWDLKLVARCGMGSENGKSFIQMILIGTMEQSYKITVLSYVLAK